MSRSIDSAKLNFSRAKLNFSRVKLNFSSAKLNYIIDPIPAPPLNAYGIIIPKSAVFFLMSVSSC